MSHMGMCKRSNATEHALAFISTRWSHSWGELSIYAGADALAASSGVRGAAVDALDA
jgi:hypothetical protein